MTREEQIVPRWLWTAIGAVALAIVTGAAAWAAHIDHQVNDLARDIATLRQSREEIQRRLERIETKLDNLLERKAQ